MVAVLKATAEAAMVTAAHAEKLETSEVMVVEHKVRAAVRARVRLGARSVGTVAKPQVATVDLDTSP